MSIMFDKKRPTAIHAILGGDGEKDQETGPGELEQCAHELIEAVHARSVPDAVSAFKAMFACLESEPHEEYGED